MSIAIHPTGPTSTAEWNSMKKNKKKLNPEKKVRISSNPKQKTNRWKLKPNSSKLKTRDTFLTIKSDGQMWGTSMTGQNASTLIKKQKYLKQLRSSVKGQTNCTMRLKTLRKIIILSQPSSTTTRKKTTWLDTWMMQKLISIAPSTPFPLGSAAFFWLETILNKQNQWL